MPHCYPRRAMQQHSCFILALLIVAVPPATHAARTAGSPMEKVIAMMTSLQQKVTSDGEAEDKAYNEFVEWCDDTARAKGQEVKTLTGQKNELQSTIDKALSDIDNANAAIEQLGASLSEDEDKVKTQTEIRKKEKADFVAAEKELVDAIDMITRAVSVLEKESGSGASMLQGVAADQLDEIVQGLGVVTEAAGFAASDTNKLVSLLAEAERAENEDEADDEDKLMSQDKASQKKGAGSIIEVLEDMKDKTESKLGDMRKAEKNMQMNFELVVQSLNDEIAAAEKDLKEEKKKLASAGETKSTAEGDLSVTMKSLMEAMEALSDTKNKCMEHAADYEIVVKARNDELKALAVAKKIIQAAATSFVQAPRANSDSDEDTDAETTDLVFVQLGSKSRNSKLAGASKQVLTLLKKMAKKQKSPALTQLASRIQAVLRFGGRTGEDPFKKVKGLISDMIEKLSKEMSEEADEKAYCDQEMAKTKAKKTDLEETTSGIKAKIDTAASDSAKLKSEVKELQEELATLQGLQAEMDKARQDEHEAYKQAKADLEGGLHAIRSALQVLRDYYGGGDDADAAFVQKQLSDTDALGNPDGSASFMEQPDPPASGKKKSGAGSDIISMLEVCESDYAKDLAELEKEESDAQDEYDSKTQENEMIKATKNQDVKYKTSEYKSLDKAVSELSSDFDTANAELSAVLEYYSKVKERCVAKPESYAERKRRREAEIAGLKEAASILEGSGAAFLQKRSPQ
eukprot:gnl/TRDRNA2_/TRDRNA2_177613_c1_seq1.p1 gnl/TRDRNA2_/TRDRNA2_177613_c1~~gnl/TRDRNA2_/TRDRNA2_177613_c1_seq1.p1  ORF type:complete len:745 (-),score=263.34 gnl/TRDRNA2_/TRDRNA2_177613_c1_seq1:373-2607(-)